MGYIKPTRTEYTADLREPRIQKVGCGAHRLLTHVYQELPGRQIPVHNNLFLSGVPGERRLGRPHRGRNLVSRIP